MTLTLVFLASITTAALLAFWIGRTFFFLLKLLILAALIYFVATRVDFQSWKEKLTGPKALTPAQLL